MTIDNRVERAKAVDVSAIICDGGPLPFGMHACPGWRRSSSHCGCSTGRSELVVFPKTQIEIWRREYRGKTPFEDVVQLQMVPERKSWIVHYFDKMGIASEIVDLMYSTPSTSLRVLSEAELAKVKLVTDSQAGQSLIEQLAR